MGKKKQQSLSEKLSFNEDMELYECEHALDGKPIGVSISCEGCESDLPMLAEKAEALLSEWPMLRERVLKAARKELVSIRCIKRGDESKVTLESLVPFSLMVQHEPDPDREPYYSFSIDIPDVLEEHQHFDYASNFDGTSESTEVVYLM